MKKTNKATTITITIMVLVFLYFGSSHLRSEPSVMTDGKSSNSIEVAEVNYSDNEACQLLFENPDNVNAYSCDELDRIKLGEFDTKHIEIMQVGPNHFVGKRAIQKAIEFDGMIGVIGVNKQFGWAFAREIDVFWEAWDTPFNDPGEIALLMRDYEEKYGNVRFVNVYDFYGENVIDQFKISGAAIYVD